MRAVLATQKPAAIEAPKVRNSHSPAATPWDKIILNSGALKGRHNFRDANHVAPSGLRIKKHFNPGRCRWAVAISHLRRFDPR